MHTLGADSWTRGRENEGERARRGVAVGLFLCWGGCTKGVYAKLFARVYNWTPYSILSGPTANVCALFLIVPLLWPSLRNSDEKERWHWLSSLYLHLQSLLTRATMPDLPCFSLRLNVTIPFKIKTNNARGKQGSEREKERESFIIGPSEAAGGGRASTFAFCIFMTTLTWLMEG